ncbi:MAG: response regulator transcription factor [Anaerolineae bacterium]
MDRSPPCILVVEDEANIRSLLQRVLRGDGYEVEVCPSGEMALDFLKREPFDLLIVDIRLPGMTGIELLRRLRRSGSSIQVIVITGHASVETAVQALRGEAFDYLVKPFALNELRETVRQAIQTRPVPTPRPDVVCWRDLVINLTARKVWVGEREVELTNTEFEVLACLAGELGTVVPIEKLLRDVWSPDPSNHPSIRTVRSHIRRLRRKLGDNPRNPRFILNVWGLGYQLGK